MQDRTKTDILVAFNTLIEKKGFDKITVQMIIDEAGIGRATFYRYFKDKYDVMNYNYMKFLEEYLLSGRVQTFEDFFLIMTTSGTDFFRNKIKIFDSTGPNSFNNFMYEATYNSVKFVLAMRGVTELTPTEVMKYQFLCHGIPHLYEAWIKGEYPDVTPLQATETIYELLPPELKGNLWER